ASSTSTTRWTAGRAKRVRTATSHAAPPPPRAPPRSPTAFRIAARCSTSSGQLVWQARDRPVIDPAMEFRELARINGGYAEARILHAAVTLGLFDRLDAPRRTGPPARHARATHAP